MTEVTTLEQAILNASGHDSGLIHSKGLLIETPVQHNAMTNLLAIGSLLDHAPSAVEYNMLGSGANDLMKYYRFALLRYAAVRKAQLVYHEAGRAFRDYASGLGEFNGPATDEYLILQERLNTAREQVEIEVESFVIFSTMALDRAAWLHEQFFGPASKPWESFRSFEYLEGYATKRGYTAPSAELLQAIKWLGENLVEFRHLYLVHKQEGENRPRYMIGVSQHMETSEISFGVHGVLYPQPDEAPFKSVEVKAMMDTLDRFMNLWVDYLRANIRME